MTTIEFRVIDEKQAEKVAEMLNGKTYYNFIASWYSYPCKGNEFVTVSTQYEGATEMDVFSMVAEIMANAL